MNLNRIRFFYYKTCKIKFQITAFIRFDYTSNTHVKTTHWLNNKITVSELMSFQFINSASCCNMRTRPLNCDLLIEDVWPKNSICVKQADIAISNLKTKNIELHESPFNLFSIIAHCDLITMSSQTQTFRKSNRKHVLYTKAIKSVFILNAMRSLWIWRLRIGQTSVAE